MSKQEVYLDYLRNKYEGIDTIINGDEYTEEDVKWYMRFQDSNKIYKGLQNWLTYRQLIDKIKRVGINGVLMRSDVSRTYKSAEDDGRGNIIKYIVVETNYGDVYVGKNGTEVV